MGRYFEAKGILQLEAPDALDALDAPDASDALNELAINGLKLAIRIIWFAQRKGY